VTSAHPNDAQIRALYAQFLDGWNRRSGGAGRARPHGVHARVNQITGYADAQPLVLIRDGQAVERRHQLPLDGKPTLGAVDGAGKAGIPLELVGIAPHRRAAVGNEEGEAYRETPQLHRRAGHG
jgi:hypothetical protein